MERDVIGYARHLVTVTDERRIMLPADAGDVAKVIAMLTDWLLASAPDDEKPSREAAANQITMTSNGEELVLTVQVQTGTAQQFMPRAEHQAYVGEVRGRLMEITRAADDLLTGDRFPGMGEAGLAIVRAKIGVIQNTAIELSRKGGA